MMTDEEITAALKKWFHHDAFRAGQLQPIQEVLAGRDTVVVMPTGSGKSLCYQLAAMLLPGTTLVISPLIALMKDQVDALDKLGIPATFLNSSVDPDDMRGRLYGLSHGRYKLVYIAPERFRNLRFMEVLAQAAISLLTIDEAHCISQWGHDFRPDYLNIRTAMSHFSNVRVMAVTATATPDVRKDIVTQLGLGLAPRQPPTVHVQGFERPNLHLAVCRCKSHDVKLSHVLNLLRRYHSGIIYCATRKHTDDLYETLTELSPAARGDSEILQYNGAMSDEDRARIQDRFTQAAHPVVIATNAFGMGVDRADLRFIVHWDVPGSIEAYYQEVGRAGRDGQPSFCELLYNFADVKTQEFFIKAANPPREDAELLLATVRADCAKEPQTLSTDEWATRSGLKNGMEARTIFGIFERANIVSRQMLPGSRICTTTLLPDPGPDALNKQYAARAEKAQRDDARLQAMLDFVDTTQCRHAYILNYFGEETHRDDVCGGCDNCGDRPPAMAPNEEQWIIIQKALSCVGHINGRFGLNRTLQILRGERDATLIQKGLTQLSTYGLLRDKSKEFLRDLFKALFDTGCLIRTEDEYHLVSLTNQGRRVVQRKAPEFKIRWPLEAPVIGLSALSGFRTADTLAAPRRPRERWREATLRLPSRHEEKPSPAPRADRPRPASAAGTTADVHAFGLPTVQEWQAAHPVPVPAAPEAVPALEIEEIDTDPLYQALRTWRAKIAAARRMPAFHVMSNRTLAALTAARPTTVEALRTVKGMGPTLISKYGNDILAIVNS